MNDCVWSADLEWQEDSLPVGAEGESFGVAVGSVGGDCHQLKKNSGEAQTLGAAGTHDFQDLGTKQKITISKLLTVQLVFIFAMLFIVFLLKARIRRFEFLQQECY